MKQSPLSHNFRPDIEGLRAVAVLLVIACHSELPRLAGGFIGVDVFFVISGYLITRMLMQEWQRRDGIDVAAFYARRMRRLLPAFTVMLLFTMGGIWYVYAPPEQPFLLRSAFAAALYFSNIRYTLTSTDYMAPSAKLDPLLHTWSLGVEEQFYLVWPLMLVTAGLLARRTGRTATLPLILTSLGLISLTACIVLTGIRQPMAFFLPFTRAWEFCLGAAVVLLEGRVLLRTSISSAGASASLLMILTAAVLLTPTSAFPGIVALIPALGTALLILLVPCLDTGHAIKRLLGLPPMQWLGRLSYGWYLWHWPLLVIGDIVFPGRGIEGNLATAGLALLIAQFSYFLIEQPVRTSIFFARKPVALACAAAVIVLSLTLISGVSHYADNVAQGPRFKRFYSALSDTPVIYAYRCDGWFYDAKLTECVSGATNGRKTAVLLGDSHAGQWFSAFNKIMHDAGWSLDVMTKSSCPIVDQDYFYDRIGRIFTECAQWRQAALAKIQAIHPDLVIVASAEDYPFSPTEWEDGTSRILSAIAPSTGNVVVLRDTPRPGFSVPECLARREWNPNFYQSSCTFDYRTSLSEPTLRALEEAVKPFPNVHLLDLTKTICDQNPCAVESAEAIKYRDTRHLTDSFVRTLTPRLRTTLVAARVFTP